MNLQPPGKSGLILACTEQSGAVIGKNHRGKRIASLPGAGCEEGEESDLRQDAPALLAPFLHLCPQNSAPNEPVPESQRDSIRQPRVGESASLPWVMRFIFTNPTGLHHLRNGMMQPAFGVGNHFDSFPRVVAPLPTLGWMGRSGDQNFRR